MAECAFGAEISGNRSRCVVAKAYRIFTANPALVADPPSRLAVKIVWAGVPAMALDVLDALYVADEPVDVALDPRSQSVTLCDPLLERGIVVKRLGPEDVAVAHGEFMDAVTGGGLKHFDQPVLTAAVRGAAQRPLAGAVALDRKASADQAPLNAAEFAVWALRRWEELSDPGVYVL